MHLLRLYSTFVDRRRATNGGLRFDLATFPVDVVWVLYLQLRHLPHFLVSVLKQERPTLHSSSDEFYPEPKVVLEGGDIDVRQL